VSLCVSSLILNTQRATKITLRIVEKIYELMKKILLTIILFISFISLSAQKSGTIIIDDVVRRHFRQEIMIPDIPGYVTLKCDFHIHTVFSDGNVWPTVRISEAWEDGLDAIALTDHIEGNPKKMPGQKRSQYDVALAAAKASNIILVRAGEISRSMPPGHFNALFVKDVDALDLPDVMDALNEASRQGGFIIWNHPGWRKQQPDSTRWMPEHEKIYSSGLMHGIEVFNEKEWYPEAIRWAMEKNMAIIGNSDIHDYLENFYDTDKYPIRPMTLVFAKERTEESLKEAMFAKRTATLFFNKLVGKKVLIEPLVKQSIVVSKPYLYLDGYAYFTLRNMTDIEFTLVKTGSDGSELPGRIILPARATIILRAKQPEGKAMIYSFNLENVLTGVEQYYEYNISIQ
jgi:3',5'-nucleoside bisphosphate phosphatase